MELKSNGEAVPEVRVDLPLGGVDPVCELRKQRDPGITAPPEPGRHPHGRVTVEPEKYGGPVHRLVLRRGQHALSRVHG